jgi:endonuclease YncB( thermonuclease family)
MQKWVVGILAGLAGMAVGAALVVLERTVHPLPQPAPAAQVAALPPVPEPAPEPPPAAAPEPAPPAAPDLPTVDVAPLAVHAVPDQDTPAPKVTVFDHNGRDITPRGSSGPPASYVPSPSPAYPSPAYPSPPSQAPSRTALVFPQFSANKAIVGKPVQPSVANFSGMATAGGGTSLLIGGKTVALFGVRPGDPRDQCGLGPGDSRSCTDVARDALAQRLQHYGNVSCRVPPGQRGDPAAVCNDSGGTDLGGFLVAEGLALADTNKSYDYFGAEGVARSFRRGLWRNR